jgi:aryl-alcohol dehydrogenase-like predicted oxidoreductase
MYQRGLLAQAGEIPLFSCSTEIFHYAFAGVDRGAIMRRQRCCGGLFVNTLQEFFHPRRELGKTGFVATVLGIGDVADRKLPLEQCVATVRRAIDAGLNVIDTAPGYEEGYSEQIVGQAVKPCRQSMFVIDKIDRVHDAVAPQVEASLHRLDMEWVDLFVFHGLSTVEGWRRIAGVGGGMEQLQQCIQAGKARFRGISSHDPCVLQEAIVSGFCDVVMFAIGPYVHRRYVDEILPLARKHGVGTVCFKTFGAGKLVADTCGYNKPLAERPRGKLSSGSDATVPALTDLTAQECLHYTLTCDPDVALLGLSFPNEQDVAFKAAIEFQRLTPAQMKQIEQRAVQAIAGKGKNWWNPGGV